jgi:hypothetical protein
MYSCIELSEAWIHAVQFHLLCHGRVNHRAIQNYFVRDYAVYLIQSIFGMATHVRKISYEKCPGKFRIATVLRCSSTLEINRIWEMNEVTCNTYSSMQYVSTNIVCSSVRPLTLPCLYVVLIWISCITYCICICIQVWKQTHCLDCVDLFFSCLITTRSVRYVEKCFGYKILVCICISPQHIFEFYFP